MFIILLAIVISLGSALVQMLTDKGSSEKMMKSLMVRVLLSFFFIGLMFVLYKTGYIQPNSRPY
ncbi:MAG: twin transmembrane helix small protein [Gammaproteobacteria bacterium]|nr:twin transmembrane helix small protein [Gammaproteobacteria bacterium]